MNAKFLFIGLILLIMYMPHLVIGQQQTARLTVSSDFFEASDTLELYIWRDLIGYELYAPHQVISQPASRRKVVFELDSLIENSFIALYFSYQKLETKATNGIIRLARINDGDDIQIELTPERGKYRNVNAGYDNGNPVFIHNWGCTFSGVGSQKVKAAYINERYLEEIELNFKRPRVSNLDDANYILKFYTDKVTSYNNKLNSYMGSMDAIDYEKASVDGIGSIYRLAINSLLKLIYFSPKEERKQFLPALESLFEDTKSALISSEQIAKSPEYLGYIKKYFDAMMYIEQPKDGLSKIVSLVNDKIENKLLRDRLIAQTMIDDFYRRPKKELYDYAMYNISDSYSLYRVESLKMFLKGNEFLEFSLPDESGKYHKLSEYKGKVVLIDFWYMGCMPCRAYIEKVIMPLVEKYDKDLEIEFILINLDKQEVFKRVINEGVVPKQAINLNTEGLQFSHPLIKKLTIPGYPYPMLIDKRGKLVAVGNALKDLNSLENLIIEEKKSK